MVTVYSKISFVYVYCSYSRNEIFHSLKFQQIQNFIQFKYSFVSGILFLYFYKALPIYVNELDDSCMLNTLCLDCNVQ